MNQTKKYLFVMVKVKQFFKKSSKYWSFFVFNNATIKGRKGFRIFVEKYFLNCTSDWISFEGLLCKKLH